jgi:hypothetical protein
MTIMDVRILATTTHHGDDNDDHDDDGVVDVLEERLEVLLLGVREARLDQRHLPRRLRHAGHGEHACIATPQHNTLT